MAKEKSFGSSDRAEMQKWFDEQMKAGRTFRDVKREARTKFGAFDWSTIIAILIDLIRKWLEKK